MKLIFAITVLMLPLLASAQRMHQMTGAQIKSPAYQSTFSRYRLYADEPIGAWRDDNERVRKAGGWRTYAREASQSESLTVDAPSSHGTPQSGLQK